VSTEKLKFSFEKPFILLQLFKGTNPRIITMKLRK
jgi:hypothetical protein